MWLPEQVWAGGEPPSRRRRLVTGGAGPLETSSSCSLLPPVQAHPAGPLSWPEGHVDLLPRLGRTHEHVSLKLWVSELGLLIGRRCPQELDVKGSLSPKALWRLVLPPAPFRAAQSPCLWLSSQVRASHEGRWGPSLSCLCPNTCCPHQGSYPGHVGPHGQGGQTGLEPCPHAPGS